MDLLQAELADRLLVPPKVFLPPHGKETNAAVIPRRRQRK